MYLTDDVKLKQDIHWWEASNKSRIFMTSKLKKILIYKRKSLKLKQKDLAKILKIKKQRIYNYEHNKRYPTISVFLKWLKILNISKESVEKYIILFNPPQIKLRLDKFPYRELPKHAEIIAHILFDGTLSRGNSFYYETHHFMEQERFNNLIRKCNMDKALYSCMQSGIKMYGLSSVASNLLINHYKFKKNRISEKVMNYALKNKEWRNAILRACFIDEGSAGKNKLRDNILVASSLKNKILVNQILKLLKKEHSCRLCTDNNRNEFTILLHNKSLIDFYDNTLKDLQNNYYKKINAQRMIDRLQYSKFKW